MTDIHSAATPIKENFTPSEVACDFVWGAEDIGAVIGLSRPQTHYLLRKGGIKTARKVGGKWVCSRSALLREFGA
jgi:hypothetical protein